MQLEPTGFIRPYPQSALNGAMGLTSEDVARAISVQHMHLMQDLRGRKYVALLLRSGFPLIEISINRKGPGRKGKMFVFSVDAAKAIVAASRTESGAEYLRYLLACEKKAESAEDIIPKLMALIADLQAKVEALTKPRRIAGPGRRHRVVAGFQSITDLWGNVAQVPVYRDLAFSEMTDDERRAYEAQHLAKISSGASSKAAKLINKEIKPGKGSRHVALIVVPKG